MMADGQLPPATVVDDRYEVVRLVGVGGLAEVYEVRHIELGSTHALKLLTWSRRDLADRMLLEGRIQAQLTHPNVVRVTDVLRHQGQVALLMEYVNGPSLDELLSDGGGLDLDRTLDVFAALLGAVDHAHTSGVLHRDLKPANVLLARAPGGWIPKVTDFGLAKVVEALSGTRTGLTMGTPGFMAPEQVRDSTNVDQRTDVFALGCILFQMLSGRRAYEPTHPDSDLVEITATIEQRPPRLDEVVPTVPGYVASAVERATEIDPDARFTDCRAFATALGLQQHPALALMPGIVAVPLSLPTISGAPPTPAPAPPAQSSLGPTWSIPVAVVAAAFLFGIVGVGLLGTALWLQLQATPVQEPMAIMAPATEAAPPDAAPAEVADPPDQVIALVDPPEAAAEPPQAAAEPPQAAAEPPQATTEPPQATTEDPGLPVEADPAEPDLMAAAEAAPPAELPQPPGKLPVASPESVTEAPALDDASQVPETSEQLPLLPVGAWSGLIDDRKRMTLRVTQSDPEQLEIVRAIPVGTGNDLVVRLQGSLDRGSGAVSLRAVTGDATFEGTWDGRTLEGRYRAGRRQEQAWSLVYDP